MTSQGTRRLRSAARLALGAAGLLAALGLCAASGCALIVGADFDDKTLFICEPCYTGPPQTELRGACVAGCIDENDACAGEIVPRTEDCATDGVDDNCDGTRPCDGGPLFARSFGDFANQGTTRVAVDGASNVVLAIDAESYVDYGGGGIGSSIGNHVHVVKLDEDGGYRWSRSFGGDTGQFIGDVAVDRNGNVVVSGHFYGILDVGGGVMTSQGDLDVYVTKMDADGNFVWGFPAGDGNIQFSNALAVDNDGNVIVAGYTNGTLSLGPNHAISSAGAHDIFVAKLDPGGVPLWIQRYGDGADQVVSDVAVGPSGEIAITGTFKGTVDFGGGPYTDDENVNDGFVAVLEPAAGGHVWSHPFKSCCDTQGIGVAFDAAGRVYVTGRFQGTADFAGETRASAGAFDAFLVAYDTGGQLLWSRAFGDGADQVGHVVTVDGAGQIILGGQAAGEIDFGAGPVSTAGDADAFVAKFNASGDAVWGRVLGDPGGQVTLGLATLPLGEIFAIGYFDSSLHVDDIGLGSAGSNDTWLAKLQP